MKLPVSLSNRHIHLSKTDAEILFWEWHELTNLKELSQPGQFACEEVVTIKGPKSEIGKVRVLGPYRNQTQIEILMWDNYKLGTKAPIRMSGDLAGSEAIEIIWPKGSVQLEEGLIVAQRHIHMTLEDLEKFNVTDGQVVDVEVQWERGMVFHNVIVRWHKDFALDMHIDSEEWNAAGISIRGTEGEII